MAGGVSVTLVSEVSTPPATSNIAVSTILPDMVLVSFGYFDPMQMKAETSGGVTAQGRVFQQIALTRDAFTTWLRGTLLLMATMPPDIRGAYGYEEWAKILAAGARPEQPPPLPDADLVL